MEKSGTTILLTIPVQGGGSFALVVDYEAKTISLVLIFSNGTMQVRQVKNYTQQG